MAGLCVVALLPTLATCRIVHHPEPRNTAELQRLAEEDEQAKLAMTAIVEGLAHDRHAR